MKMKCEGDLGIIDANRIMYEHEQLKIEVWY